MFTDITKEEGQISAESKEGSSCSTSHLPEKMDHPGNKTIMFRFLSQ